MHVLLDMDGVLVDFIRGALEVHDIKTPKSELYANHLGSWDLVKILDMAAPKFWKPMNEEFWSKLEWMEDGKEILADVERLFGQENITLWTSPSANYGCHEGKLRWIERHLPRHYKHNVIFGHKKDRGAAPDTVLVDDSDSNIEKFGKRGGLTCLAPRYWNKEYKDQSSCAKIVRARLEVIKNGPYRNQNPPEVY